jgi:3-mercaptopyruvate sulfurtransferase SseA
MANKETALDWAIKQINNKSIKDGDYRTINDIFKQAKEMEKEHIEEAHFMGLRRNSFDPYQDSIIYFQKTYGKI